MFRKIQGCFRKFTGAAKLQINKSSKAIKVIIVCYGILVALLVLTYYVAWLWQWYNDSAVLSDLLAVIQEVVGASMVALISFIGGSFVDLNGNGVPDTFEEKKEDEF